jgi:segregation and condensation protein A
MAIPLKLQVFEGPMDLLMHLIEKNKIDIYDIPIVTITDQYLDYVHRMEHNDMNVTSEFLVMAATLLDIKSRMLLPREENEEGEEEDPRDELVRRLLEYKMYKYMSEELKEKNRHAGMSYFRPQDLPEEVRSYVPPLNYEELIGDRTVQSLETVFKEVLKRKKSSVDPVRSGFGKIQKEEISVADRELYIRAYLAEHPHADFREMLELENSKEEIIVTFLVILELMKHQKIRITQEEAFGRILIDLIDPGEEKAEPETEAVTEEESEPETMPEAESETEAEPEMMPEAEQEPEPMPETKAVSAMTVASVTTSIPAPLAEPEPIEDPMPEPEPIAEPTPEAEEEPKPPIKRHLVYRSGQHRLGGGRYVFRYAVGRKRIFFFHKMRGNRIWKRNRKRNKGKHV